MKISVKLGNEMIVGDEKYFLIFQRFIDTFSADKWFAGPVEFVYRGHQCEE